MEPLSSTLRPREDPGAMLRRLVRTVIDHAAPLALDAEPIRWKSADEKGVRPVRRACRARSRVAHRLRTPLNRNAFLCGCLDYTEHEALEHLIVGLGYRHGSTTKVVSIAHVLGNKNSVAVPSWVLSAITDHLRTDARAEALLFHNHPKWWANDVLDNAPLPSVQDRRALEAQLLKPEHLIRKLFGAGTLRFYLGENGFVREFRSPPIESLLRWVGMLEGGSR